MNEEEMKKMLDEMPEMAGMPKGICVTVQFDKELQKITGLEKFPMMMSEGAPFTFLLQSIFIEYPEIEEKYPPGVLGFSINGIPPRAHAMLFDGDTVIFSEMLRD